MNNIDPVILGDMSAVRDKGLTYVHQNYFWPVSEEEFSKFSRFMHDEYIEIIKNENNAEINDIAVVEFSFVKQLLQIFHYNYVKEYSKINNLDLVTGVDSEYLVNPNWDKIKRYYSSLKPQHNKLLRIIRKIVRSIIFNRHLSLFRIIKGLLFSSNFTSIGSNDQIKHEFIKINKVFCSYVDWPELVNTTIAEDKKINEYGKLFTENIINPYLKKLADCDSLFVKNINFDKISDVWSTRILEAYLLYLNFRISAISSKLLVTEMSKPINKLITVAYQSEKCKVFCFHHGHDSVAKISKLTFATNIAHCHNFIVPTNGIKARYQKHYSNVHSVVDTSTKFISVNSKIMHKLYLKNISNIVNYKVNTVMIMGYPCEPTRYLDGKGLFFYQQIDLEYQIISILKEEGKRIVYKAHPERLSEIEGIFSHLVDEVIVDSFEKVWEEADLLIFTYSETTTFGYALTTNIPIILLDAEGDMRDSSDMKLFDKRVIRIPAKINKNTQINFDKNILIKAVTQSKYNISYDYVEDIYG